MSSPWTPDGALYLANTGHTEVRRMYQEFKRRLGLRYDEQPTPRQRRQFDVEVVMALGKQYPPPTRTPWVLMSYGIQDAEEDRKARLARPPVTVSVPVGYVDEDLF